MSNPNLTNCTLDAVRNLTEAVSRVESATDLSKPKPDLTPQPRTSAHDSAVTSTTKGLCLYVVVEVDCTIEYCGVSGSSPVALVSGPSALPRSSVMTDLGPLFLESQLALLDVSLAELAVGEVFLKPSRCKSRSCNHHK